ncbi:MAG: DegV family protein [Clostridia bacterium]|nr:DegV family protein [Clostridia bacterium]
MNKFVILIDSASDLKPEFLEKLDIRFISLSFVFDGEEKIYGNYDLSPKEFYNQMRNGKSAKTSAANVAEFKDFFEAELKSGNDILYLGFSSGLSTTYNSAVIAADELLEQYPDRKIICIDSLAASAGFGMFVYLTAKEKEKGKTLDETANFAKEIIPSLAHWFTVDDLEYLKRGGRVSPTVAFVGGLLGIKPILHVDDEGHLIKVSTARGRKASLTALADELGNTILPDSPVWISHGDCEDDAKLLADIIKEKYSKEVTLITDVGPVIGAHSGPGTMALFFLATKR